MKIVIFYRSNEASNRYISSTKSQTDSQIKNFANSGVSVHYENLDKRKFQNYFKKQGVPEVVFVWHDEEILIEYTKDNFPDTKIELMSGDDREYGESYYGYKKNTFNIYGRICNAIDENIPKKKVYYIKDYAIKSKLVEIQSDNFLHFPSEKSAEDKLKTSVDGELKATEDRIAVLTNKLDILLKIREEIYASKG